jgi:3',5'-cyclic AMP phosphodiesterase CpdA
MPVTLPPISRRRFIASSVAAGLGLVLRPHLLHAEDLSFDPHRFALLSDTHIAAKPAARERGVVMHDHLKQVCDEVIALASAPATALINGDCAYYSGQKHDYATFLDLIRPLRQRGLSVHLTMGNHDERENLWAAVPQSEEHVKDVPERQIVLLETPRANWIMLDSLDKTSRTPGLLGENQLAWLKSALDERKDKPAIVLVHHQPDFRKAISGLIDTGPLLDILVPRKQVKALLYGHTHEWVVTKRDDLHCINLPAVAYVFSPGQPSGWVDCHLDDDRMSIELRCIDPSHPRHGERHDLIWRS